MCFLLLVAIYVRFMNQSDISYIVELLKDALESKDWDTVIDAVETMKEYLDDDNSLIGE